MERRIFTINTNDPAVKLAVVQTVVLCTSTSCVTRSEPVCLFPIYRARAGYEHTEQTANRLWGDIHWIWQKVYLIRIADCTFKSNRFVSTSHNGNMFIEMVYLCQYIIYLVSEFSQHLLLRANKTQSCGKWNHIEYQLGLTRMLRSFKASPVAVVIDVQISIRMLCCCFFVIYAWPHKSQIAHEIWVYVRIRFIAK